MIQYIKSYYVYKSADSETHIDNLANFKLSDLYNLYLHVYHEVKDTISGVTYYIDMSKYKEIYNHSSDTVLVFLSNLSKEEFTATEPPFEEIVVATYHDAHRAGYRAYPSRIGVSLDTNLPLSYKKDLAINRPDFNTDLKDVFNTCLVTVNGYVHYLDFDGSILHVKDGGSTYLRTKDNQLGFINFSKIGKINCSHFNDADIKNEVFPNEQLRPLNEKIILSLNKDITNKSVILSLGGYLIFPEENLFYQSGNNEFTLIPNSIDLVGKFLESYNYLDNSSLGLDLSVQYPDRINIQEFLSDEVLRKYLMMSQTFIIIVDNPELYTNKIAIRRSTYPGMFVTYQEPIYPLITNHGKIGEYWKTHEDGQWSVNVNDIFLKNFTLTDKLVSQLNVVTTAQNPTIPFYKTQGVFLRISSVK